MFRKYISFSSASSHIGTGNIDKNIRAAFGLWIITVHRWHVTEGWMLHYHTKLKFHLNKLCLWCVCVWMDEYREHVCRHL